VFAKGVAEGNVEVKEGAVEYWRERGEF